MSQKLMHVGVGLNLDDSISFLHGAGVPGSSGGFPDQAKPGSLYSNDTDGNLWTKFRSGIGVDKWRKIEGIIPPSSVSNVISEQVIDFVSVDDISLMKWIVEAKLASNQSIKYVAEITATHDGTETADATRADFSEYSVVGMNGTIPGLNISVDVSGSGVNQILRLVVSSGSLTNVTSYRIQVGNSTTEFVALDLTSVPQDVSSTIIGNIQPNSTVLFYTPTRTMKTMPNFVNSKALAEIAGVTPTVFSIKKINGVTFSESNLGTITFSANSRVGTWSGAGNVVLNAGDGLKVVSSDTPDSTLANLCFTIQASYL